MIYTDEIDETSADGSLVHTDADLTTHREDRARRTVGETPCTYMFAKRHEQTVDLYPILSREDSFERSSGFFWRGRLHILPTVCHPMDVDINSNAWLTTGNAKYEIGALRPDPSQ
jgi:hypothetical protein